MLLEKKLILRPSMICPVLTVTVPLHAIHYNRDAMGRITEEYLTDLSGKKMKNYNDEVFLVRTNYNPQGQEESFTYWADSLTPMPSWNGVYKRSFKYDGDGSITEVNNYDQNGLWFKTADGSSTMRMFYQENGQVFRREFSLLRIIDHP